MLAGEGAHRDALTVTGLRKDKEVGAWLRHGHGDHKVTLAGEANADDATCGAAHGARLALVEATDAPLAGGHDEVVFTGGLNHLGKLITLIKGDGDDAGGADLFKLFDRGLLDDPLLCGEGEVAARREPVQDDGGNWGLTRLHLYARKIDDRNPLVLSRGVRDLVHLRAKATPLVGEEEGVVVGVGDLQRCDRILFARGHADHALAAAVLLAIGGERLTLDIAAARDGDHHIFVGDQVLVGHFSCCILCDLGAASVGELLLELGELIRDDFRDARRARQDVFQLGDELDDFEILVFDLLALEGGETRKAHVENCLRLQFTKLEALHELCASNIDVGRSANGLDDRIKIIECDLEPFEDVGALTGLLEFVFGATAHDDAAMIDVMLQYRFQ